MKYIKLIRDIYLHKDAIPRDTIHEVQETDQGEIRINWDGQMISVYGVEYEFCDYPYNVSDVQVEYIDW